MSFPAKAFGATAATAPLGPVSIARRDIGPQDVEIRILFLRRCHSDLHQVRNEWQSVMPTVYPCVPGHEIVGRVARVGRDVKRFREKRSGCGGLHGVLLPRVCFVPRRRGAVLSERAHADLQRARHGARWRHVRCYSEAIVVDHNYVLRVPQGQDPAGAAPLLCAGITTYSPLRHWKIGKGHRSASSASAVWATWA